MSAQSLWPVKPKGSKKECDSARRTRSKRKDGNRNANKKSNAESISNRRKEREELSRETGGYKTESSPKRRMDNFVEKFNSLKKKQSRKHEVEEKPEKKPEKSEPRQKSPPMDTAHARSPPESADDYDKPTVFEKVRAPIRPFVSKPKRKKAQKFEAEADIKTAKTEGGSIIARADSDIRTAHGEEENSRTESVRKSNKSDIKKDVSNAEEVKENRSKEGGIKEKGSSSVRKSKEKIGSKESLKKVHSKENVKKDEKRNRNSEESDVRSEYVQDKRVKTPKKKSGKRPERLRSEECYREEYAKSEYVEDDDHKTYEEKPKKPTDDSSKDVKSCYFGYYK